MGFGFGTETSGIAVSGNWAHSEDDGDIAGLGLGYNIPLGPFLGTVGGKGVYLNPNAGSEGYAIAVGGGLQWQIASSFSIFGEYYYSPDSLSSGVKEYRSQCRRALHHYASADRGSGLSLHRHDRQRRAS